MTHEQLGQRHSAITRKWARTIADMTDHVAPGLLADLANVADEHAIGENAAAVDRVLAARTATPGGDGSATSSATVARRSRKPPAT
jgi:hypothetical protein